MRGRVVGSESERIASRWMVWAAVIIALLMAGVGLLGAPFILGGEPERHFLNIENQAGEDVTIFGVLEDGTRLRLFVLEAGTSKPWVLSDGRCGSTRLMAETMHGERIAGRPPFDDCDPEPWIIRPSGAR